MAILFDQIHNLITYLQVLAFLCKRSDCLKMIPVISEESLLTLIESKSYLLNELNFECSDLFFLRIFAFLLILQSLDNLLLFLNIFSQIDKNTALDKCSQTVFKISEARIDLSPFSSFILSRFKHRFSNSLSGLFLKISILNEKIAETILINFSRSFHFLNLQISLLHSLLQITNPLILETQTCKII